MGSRNEKTRPEGQEKGRKTDRREKKYVTERKTARQNKKEQPGTKTKRNKSHI